jgi:uncharacterized membrane protein (Fun14 family)
MSSEVLLSNIIPFAGSGLLGYAMGFALKKIFKWILIIIGFLAGMFFVGVQLLQKYGYVSAVNPNYHIVVAINGLFKPGQIPDFTRSGVSNGYVVVPEFPGFLSGFGMILFIQSRKRILCTTNVGD